MTTCEPPAVPLVDGWRFVVGECIPADQTCDAKAPPCALSPDFGVSLGYVRYHWPCIERWGGWEAPFVDADWRWVEREREWHLYTPCAQHAATVFKHNDGGAHSWFVWSPDGIGGENWNGETIEVAARDAATAARRWWEENEWLGSLTLGKRADAIEAGDTIVTETGNLEGAGRLRELSGLQGHRGL